MALMKFAVADSDLPACGRGGQELKGHEGPAGKLNPAIDEDIDDGTGVHPRPRIRNSTVSASRTANFAAAGLSVDRFRHVHVRPEY